jgi:hypothetical protein
MNVSGQLHAKAALLWENQFHVTHWIGDLLGRRAVLDSAEKRSTVYLLPAGNQNPTVQPLGRRHTDRAIVAPLVHLFLSLMQRKILF